MQLIGERIIFDVQLWKIVLIPLLVFLSLYLYRRTYPALSRGKKVLLALTRICAFSLVVLFILNPSIISMRRESRAPLVLVLLDISKSMSVKDHTGRSRFEDARAGLRILTDAIRRGSDSRVEIIPFSSELMTPADSGLAATGEGTDILRAIHEAQRRYRSENVGAVVLLTDGRITRGVVSLQVPLSVPVYAVQFGDTVERADVSIEEVFYDRTVYVGTKEEIRAVVKAIGFEGTGMVVRLVLNGEVIDEVARTVQGSNVAFEAAFEFKPENPGEYGLTIEVVTGQLEERKENNTETIRVTVRKDKLRFLYVDQHADWNTTFLRDLAAGSDRFEMEAISWLPALGHFRLGDRNSWDFPASAKDLESYDLIVFSDDTKILIDQARVNVLEEYVRGGGGLLLLMDEKSPAVRRQSMMLIEGLLPVKLTGRPRMLTGEYAVLIADGMGWNRLAAILAEEGNIDLLPPLLAQYSGLEITAGATVPLIMESSGGPQPFVAVTRYGAGVSAIVMGFPLWRWKLAGHQGGAMYDAFLGGLIQYLAEGIDAPPLDLEADRTVYHAGDRISLAVYLQGKRRPDGVRGEVFLLGGEDDAPVRTFLFQPDSGRESVFRTVLDPLPPGEYKVVAQELQDSGSGVTSETEFSILPVSVEFLKTASDIAFLRELAAGSGGEVLGAGELAKILDRLDLQEDELITKEVQALREGPLLFLCIMACFAAEWIMRKAWGLV